MEPYIVANYLNPLGVTTGGVLPDWVINGCIKIDPKVNPNVEIQPPGTISYGISSAGYDLRVSDRFLVIRDDLPQDQSIVMDPKNQREDIFREVMGNCIIPPHGFALSESIEYIEMPKDIIGICCNKSTYARCGIIVNVTPIEPEFCGTITLEISNTTPIPAIVYANEGIAQLIFIRTTGSCESSYANKNGKYQHQKGITLAKVK